MRSDVARLVIPMLVAAGLLAAGPGQAEAPTPTKVEDVLRVLRAHARATPEDLAVAGSGVDVVLTDLLVSRSVDREIRVRAAWALGGYPGSRARAVLVATMNDREEEAQVRASCMVGYARVLGPRAVGDLKPYLRDSDPVLRAGAARALGVAGGQEARDVLTEAMAHEEDLDVRLAMDEALEGLKEGK